MEVCRGAEFRCGKGMVIVKSKGGHWIIVRTSIRSFGDGSVSRNSYSRRKTHSG